MSAFVSFFRTPTRPQWISFLAAWLGWVLDAFDFTIFLLAMPAIAAAFNVSLTATASSVTLTLLLRLLGGVAAGSLADRFGRKLPLMISIVWFALCDGAIALAPSFTWVLILRALFGFGMGAEFTSGATLAMENWPKESRGIASGILQGSWAIGYMAAALVAGYVLPLYGYKVLFALAVIPALLVLPIRIWVPESHPSKSETTAREDITPAERGGMLRTIIWACIIMGVATSAYYSLSALYPTMLMKHLGLSPAAMGNHVALFNVGMLVGSVFCGWLATKKSATLAILIPALGTLPILPLYVGYFPDYLLLGAFLGGVFGAGYVGVTPVLLTSMFPARVRARSVGFVYHIGACMAATIPPIAAYITESGALNMAQTLALLTGGFQIVLVLFILFRPKDIFDAA